ncbi:hypothetical protein [Anaplasma phagocytophilum]|uniref:hypothetical protein n=1 Tax=Anaplasma phagocytophilum TaxID=948 RepID=UPI00114D2C5C|nr:hypothetical protein [Anaplasma phagocytophilum]
MKITNSAIDGKVCSGNHAKGKASSDNASITGYIDSGNGSGSKTAQCSGLHNRSIGGSEVGLTKFINETKVREDKNWPTEHVHGGSKIDTVVKTNGNAEAVATDLVNLNRDEKTIVAGMLAKTIEGGEVVEIRAVSFYLHLSRSVLWCPHLTC